MSAILRASVFALPARVCPTSNVNEGVYQSCFGSRVMPARPPGECRCAWLPHAARTVLVGRNAADRPAPSGGPASSSNPKGASRSGSCVLRATSGASAHAVTPPSMSPATTSAPSALMPVPPTITRQGSRPRCVPPPPGTGSPSPLHSRPFPSRPNAACATEVLRRASRPSSPCPIPPAVPHRADLPARLALPARPTRVPPALPTPHAQPHPVLPQPTNPTACRPYCPCCPVLPDHPLLTAPYCSGPPPRPCPYCPVPPDPTYRPARTAPYRPTPHLPSRPYRPVLPAPPRPPVLPRTARPPPYRPSCPTPPPCITRTARTARTPAVPALTARPHRPTRTARYRPTPSCRPDPPHPLPCLNRPVLPTHLSIASGVPRPFRSTFPRDFSILRASHLRTGALQTEVLKKVPGLSDVTGNRTETTSASAASRALGPATKGPGARGPRSAAPVPNWYDKWTGSGPVAPGRASYTHENTRMSSLPPCGLYRTRRALGTSIPEGRLVYFHNHGDPGLASISRVAGA